MLVERYSWTLLTEVRVEDSKKGVMDMQGPRDHGEDSWHFEDRCGTVGLYV